MKRFWHTWLAVAASTAMIGTANAQTDWNQSNEIGSYQSILARAGYNNNSPSAQDAGMTAGNFATAPAMDAQSAPGMGGCDGSGGCNGSCGGDSGSGCMGFGNNRSGGPFGQRMGNRGYGIGGNNGCSDDGVYGRTSGLGQRLGGMGLGSNAGSGVNYVFSARALFMRRDHEDDVRLTRNGAGGVLKSTDADMGIMGGVDFGLTRRTSDGNGIEFRYWGLYPGQQNSQISGPGLDTYLTGFNGIAVAPGAQNLLNYYNNSDSNGVFRANQFHNAEVNFLRNGGNYTTRSGRAGNFEMLGGFRWFQFNEDFRYSAFYAAANPSQVDYELNTKNTLLGFQVGGRNNLCLTDRVSLMTGTKVGVYNNHITATQCICDSNGVFAYRTASGVDDYNYSSTKNDLALLGEFDMGLAYRFSQSARATFGYRVVGVNGVALAPSQIPRNFANNAEINDAQSNDSLILGGGYAGLEFCY